MGKELRYTDCVKVEARFALEINLNLLRNEPSIGIATIRNIIDRK